MAGGREARMRCRLQAVRCKGHSPGRCTRATWSSSSTLDATRQNRQASSADAAYGFLHAAAASHGHAQWPVFLVTRSPSASGSCVPERRRRRPSIWLPKNGERRHLPHVCIQIRVVRSEGMYWGLARATPSESMLGTCSERWARASRVLRDRYTAASHHHFSLLIPARCRLLPEMLSVRYDRVRLHAVACRLPTSCRRCPKRRGSSSFVVPLADGESCRALLRSRQAIRQSAPARCPFAPRASLTSSASTSRAGATVCRSSSHVVARESSEERRLHAVCTQAGETLAWEV